MSNTNDQMNPVAAHNLITQQVWMPLFFEKLAADYGIQPQSEADVQSLLQMSAELQARKEAQQRQGNPLLKSALAGLTGNAAQPQQPTGELLKSASQQVAANEYIARAVLALGLQQADA